ncbi:hypothetical protein P7C70_g9117, partial [Phenoliferia sp. Uapishka_3]
LSTSAVDPPGDILDVLTPRQLSILRFSRSHDLLSSILDPFSTNAILEGKKRKKEDGEGGERDRSSFSRLAVESVPGRGDVVVLGKAGGDGKTEVRKKVKVEERRRLLERMLEEKEGEIKGLEETFGEKIQDLGKWEGLGGSGIWLDEYK